MHRCARILNSLALTSLLALLLLPPLGASAADQQIRLKSGPLTPEERELTKRFFKMWAARKDGTFANRYLGVVTLQNPLDVWITQEIFFEVKPDFVVETGTFQGGSALLWATLLGPINSEARVITIDIKDMRAPGAKSHPLAKQKVDFFLGSSTDPKILAEVTGRVKGKSVLVILDSLHTTEHVRKELELYAPLVPVGSYIIVQDTPVGPGEAIRDFLSTRDDFVVDRDRERLLLTVNKGGYLKRVK